MASILQDLGLVEAALGDVSAFASGQPISTTKTIGNSNYTASVVVLPNGPIAPYQELGGGFFAILEAVLGLGGEFAAGAPVNLAIKENKTWYGLTLSQAPKAA